MYTEKESTVDLQAANGGTFLSMEVSRMRREPKYLFRNFKQLLYFLSFLRQVVETLLTSGRGCNPRTRDDLGTRRRRHGGTPEDTEGTLGGHLDTGNLSPTKRTTTRVLFMVLFFFFPLDRRTRAVDDP